MMDMSLEQRWGVYLTQAHNFANRENYLDAVSRAGLVVDEVDEALARTTDAAARERLEEMLLRARKQREKYQAKLDEWNAAIAARRAKVIEGAAEEMAWPIPNLPVPSRRA